MFQDTRPAPLAADGRPDAWQDFRVGDPREALSLLRRLRDENVAVHLNAPDGAAITTTLWALDAEQRRLNFCADRLLPQMQRLVDTDEAVAVAYLESVKLQFDLHDLLLVHGARASALQTAWPESLYRFQRRTGYRVRTLQRHAPTATLRHPSMPEMQLALRIIDVSIGGCALALPQDVPPLQPGRTLAAVAIDLDADTAFVAALQLHHVTSIQPGDGMSRLGCSWQALAAGAQLALQRYIDQTQKRRRLLAQGGR
jgi:flagellar brake protein